MFEVICGLIIFVVLILVILAILGTKKNTKKMTEIMEKQQTKSVKSDRYCPDCGRAIPFDADICPYCHKNFNDIRKKNVVKEIKEWDKIQEQKSEAEEFKNKLKNNMKLCPSCSFENKSNSKFCKRCGAKLDE